MMPRRRLKGWTCWWRAVGDLGLGAKIKLSRQFEEMGTRSSRRLGDDDKMIVSS